jgi:starch synthase
MKILMASSEISPLAKTGGLADAAAGLADALVRLGTDVTGVMPAYRTVLEKLSPLEETGIEIQVPIAGRSARGVILKASIKECVSVYLIRADNYFMRDGLYGNSRGDYPDNAERFTFFCKAALELASKTTPWDVIHCNDWQTALIPVLKKTQSQLYPKIEKTKELLSIHNLAHQGNFAASAWNLLGLDSRYFTPHYLEFYGNINLLKGGILFADVLTTVSKKYAAEIKTSEYGCGLEGVIRDRERDLYGILNGVDYQEWNPEIDPHIKEHYTDKNPSGKKSCKEDLQRICGLPVEPTVPLIGMVSRLADQKGVDLLVDIIDDLLQMDLQLVLLGSGEQRYQELLAGLPVRHARKIAVRIGFDNALAHKIEAGADMFLMPSKFEPSGLSQMYSLKYGTIPIVRATGGLDDTIRDYEPRAGIGNGIKFATYSGPTLLEAVKRAIALYCNPQAWRRLMANAMGCDFSWQKSATEYVALYRKLIETATGSR